MVKKIKTYKVKCPQPILRWYWYHHLWNKWREFKKNNSRSSCSSSSSEIKQFVGGRNQLDSTSYWHWGCWRGFSCKNQDDTITPTIKITRRKTRFSVMLQFCLQSVTACHYLRVKDMIKINREPSLMSSKKKKSGRGIEKKMSKKIKFTFSLNNKPVFVLHTKWKHLHFHSPAHFGI